MDFSMLLSLIKLVDFEIPFMPASKASIYFDTERQILEQTRIFLENHPELDGQQTVSKAFYKLAVISAHMQAGLKSVHDPQSIAQDVRVDQDLMYEEIHKPWL